MRNTHDVKIRSAIAFLIAICVLSTNLAAQSWTTLNGPFLPRNVKDISCSVNGTTVYVTDQTYVYKSTNSGSTWSAASSIVTMPILLTNSDYNTDHVVAAISSALYRSTNGGSNWSDPVLSSISPNRLAASHTTENYMFMGRQHTDINDTHPFYKSTDDGVNWTALSSFTHATNVNDVSPMPSWANGYATYVYACGSDETTEGDPTVASDRNYNASTRGVWQTPDNGTNWNNKGLGKFDVVSVSVDESDNALWMVAGTKTGKLFRSTDGGTNWSYLSSFSNISGVNSIRKVNITQGNDYILVASNIGLHRSTNNGTTWTTVLSASPLPYNYR